MRGGKSVDVTMVVTTFNETDTSIGRVYCKAEILLGLKEG